MVNATADRQLEILEQIHALARELQDLAGDALEIIIRPSSGSPGLHPGSRKPDGGETAEPAPPGGDLQQVVVDAFTVGEWTAPAEIAERTGINKHTLRDNLARLRAAGILEHNGATARGSRWRLPPLPGGASQNGHLAPASDQDSPQERVRRACADDAATVTELAMRLDIPRRDVVSAVEQLAADGRIVPCGERLPLRHTVYGATG